MHGTPFTISSQKFLELLAGALSTTASGVSMNCQRASACESLHVRLRQTCPPPPLESLEYVNRAHNFAENVECVYSRRINRANVNRSDALDVFETKEHALDVAAAEAHALDVIATEAHATEAAAAGSCTVGEIFYSRGREWRTS